MHNTISYMETRNHDTSKLPLAGLTSVGTVELDAEVSVGTPGVVAGGEDDTAHRFMFPDQTGYCGRREYAVLSHNQPLYLQTATRQRRP